MSFPVYIGMDLCLLAYYCQIHLRLPFLPSFYTYLPHASFHSWTDLYILSRLGRLAFLFRLWDRYKTLLHKFQWLFSLSLSHVVNHKTKFITCFLAFLIFQSHVFSHAPRFPRKMSHLALRACHIHEIRSFGTTLYRHRLLVLKSSQIAPLLLRFQNFTFLFKMSFSLPQ